MLDDADEASTFICAWQLAHCAPTLAIEGTSL
jgi:hypothetical protein